MQAPPPSPADINVFFEDGQFEFRVGESKAIYVYDKDTAGVPTCADRCAMHWHPVIAASDSIPVGDWTLVTRTDKTRQWCYRRRPIYTFDADQPGQTTGDGKDGLWHVVKP